MLVAKKFIKSLVQKYTIYIDSGKCYDKPFSVIELKVFVIR